jgi:hypothetical protein
VHRNLVVFVILALMVTTGYAAGEDSYRVIIKFGSVCCGIDAHAMEHISETLSQYENKHGVSFEKHMIYWGEEGEVNMCLRLNGISAAEQEKLIERLMTAIRDPGLVKLEENAICTEGW